jgi:hypothetical protein
VKKFLHHKKILEEIYYIKKKKNLKQQQQPVDCKLMKSKNWNFFPKNSAKIAKFT